MVRSSVRPIVRSFVHSFVQIIFVQSLCSRNSDRSFVRSFDRSSFVHSTYSSFVHSHSIVHHSFIVPIHRSSFVQITFVLSLCCWNSDRSFVRSFIVPIHRSFIVTIHRSSVVHMTIHHHYSPLLFTDTIHHRWYSLPLLSIDDIYNYFFIVTIHQSSDHPKFQLLICHAVQST
jgi:hypothetical protein